jgi:8-oxo-dGTP diphosphatase
VEWTLALLRFACAVLIDTRGWFVLQQRDDIAGIIDPGKIVLFGGHREDDETYLQCIVRETHEELSYYLPPERFEHLGGYDATEVDTVFHGEFYLAEDLPLERLVVTEGQLFIARRDELAGLEHRLSSSAKAGLKLFFERSPPLV